MALGIVHIVKGEVVGSKPVTLYSLNGQLFPIHATKIWTCLFPSLMRELYRRQCWRPRGQHFFCSTGSLKGHWLGCCTPMPPSNFTR